jgi:hypothetical protein
LDDNIIRLEQRFTREDQRWELTEGNVGKTEEGEIATQVLLHVKYRLYEVLTIV